MGKQFGGRFAKPFGCEHTSWQQTRDSLLRGRADRSAPQCAAVYEKCMRSNDEVYGDQWLAIVCLTMLFNLAKSLAGFLAVYTGT